MREGERLILVSMGSFFLHTKCVYLGLTGADAVPKTKYDPKLVKTWMRKVDQVRKKEGLSIVKATTKVGCPNSIYLWHKYSKNRPGYKTAKGIRARKKRVAAKKKGKTTLNNLPIHAIPTNGNKVLAVALIGDPIEIGKAIAEIQKQV